MTLTETNSLPTVLHVEKAERAHLAHPTSLGRRYIKNAYQALYAMRLEPNKGKRTELILEARCAAELALNCAEADSA